MQIILGLLWLAAALAAIIIVPLILGGMLILGVIAWAFGAHLKIKQDGREIGYVKWFTFHRYPDVEPAVRRVLSRR